MKVFLVVPILLIVSVDFSQSLDCSLSPKNKEVELRQKLFCSYDKEVMPRFNTKNATVVTVGWHIMSFDFYESSQTITVDTWVRMEWKDDHLQWKKEEYDEISSLTVPGEDIWKPDLTSHHSEGTQFHEACSVTHCTVHSNGNILCVPPCSFSGTCQTSFKNWPFDVMKCTIRLGTWVQPGEELKFVMGNISHSKSTTNEWRLTAMASHNLRGNYSCCPNHTLPTIRYTLWIERHPASEVVFIVSPALILATLNLVSVWLTPSCSERMLLNVVSIIAHFIYLQQLSWLVPKNGYNAPDVLVYFRDSLIIATILLIDTIIKRGLLACKSPTPAWIISTTDALRGNKVGQLMFTNPYIINKVQLNTESTPGDDFTNLVEGQPTDESDTKPKTEETNIWYITVRVLDTLSFVALLITYLIMVIGWIHLGYNKAREIYSKEDPEKAYIVP